MTTELIASSFTMCSSRSLDVRCRCGKRCAYYERLKEVTLSGLLSREKVVELCDSMLWSEAVGL